MHPATATAPGNTRLIEIPKGSTAGRPARLQVIMERIAFGISWERERNSLERERASFTRRAPPALSSLHVPRTNVIDYYY